MLKEQPRPKKPFLHSRLEKVHWHRSQNLVLIGSWILLIVLQVRRNEAGPRSFGEIACLFRVSFRGQFRPRNGTKGKERTWVPFLTVRIW